MMTYRKKEKALNIVITVFVCFAAVMFILPTVLTLANSFMPRNEVWTIVFTLSTQV